MQEQLPRDVFYSLHGRTCGESQRADARVAAIDWHRSFRIIFGFVEDPQGVG
jgi:hypothetical protein